ncbi:MAG: hypothetical protein HC916_20680 [Coleofasciculaceae cyanobacterium SM2_1_6]|nr:hypothetical protein [Coleofasciculaceae cyanobacterium SM2_1_6]
MSKLIYPTVSLFLYDLRDGLGQSPAEINENRLNFWCKISPEIDREYQEIRELTKKLLLQKDQSVQPLTPEATALKTKIDKKFEKLEEKLQELEAKEDSETEFVELHYQGFADQEAYLDGMYFAIQIGDTYALQVEASDGTSKDDPAQRDDIPRSLDQLARLQELVISKVNHHQSTNVDTKKLATLGQTWLVWGKATDGKTTPEKLREIAENCFPNLTPDKNWKPDFKEVGELAGAKVFEYSHTPRDWGNNEEKFHRENYHLVILLFTADRIDADDNTPTDEIRKRVATDLTIDLIRLFAYRHKIIWSYWNSRRLKVDLKKYSQQIAELRQEMEEYKKRSPNPLQKGAFNQNNAINLNELEEKLTESWLLLAEYATKLNQLHSQSHTIETNLGNYQKRIAKIENDPSFAKPKVNLQLFQKFKNTAEERYLQQVKMDYASLGAGLTILENLTRTLDSLVNIERIKTEQQRTAAEQERNNIIAIAGLGLATSSAFAGIVATQIYQPDNKKSDQLVWLEGNHRLDWFFGLLVSLIIPVGIAFLIWFSSKKKR